MEENEIIPLTKWAKQIGRSDTTVWRWAKKGWINPINIAGKPYLTKEDIGKFIERAKAGEFSQNPHGVAAEWSKPK